MDFLGPPSSSSRALPSRQSRYPALNPALSTTGSYTTYRSFATDSETFSTASASTPFNHSRNISRPSTRASTIGRPSSSSRSRQTPSIGVRETEDDIFCAISEGRGVTPTVGICFIHTSTGEVVLSQISDNQFYVRTIHKLQMHEPSRIIMLATSCPPYPPSTLYSLIDEHVPQSRLVPMDRKSWSEASGLELLQNLASKEDAESIKVAIEGNFYITCSLAAAMSYLETNFNFRVIPHSMRVRYQPSEGTMMIDVSVIQSFELIRNLRDLKSKNCLFGLLNQTLTPMGVRMLRSNIVQPSTLKEACLTPRYDAIQELIANEEMFTELIIIPQKPSLQDSEQAINNVLMLKTFLEKVTGIFKALEPATGSLLLKVRDLCSSDIINPPLALIMATIEPNVTYVKSPLELRNQRTFAVKAGTNGLLDVARKTYQEGNEDSVNYVERLKSTFNVDISLKYDNSRMFFLKLKAADFEDRVIPDVFVNQVKKRGVIECQTIDLKKLNQRVYESAMEAVSQSDKVIQELLDSIRLQVRDLFRVCEAVALLDMLTAFTQLATLKAYVRPELTGTLALKSARHPLLDATSEMFVPNDYYATERYRFQVVTGPNMSGKSTYIRSVVLLQIMAQVGSFVPADYAAFPIIHKVFARVTTDDSIEANLSTFSVEMREMAFMLRNVDEQSLAVIDELGRGTSTNDGLAVALAMAEALIESNAKVWFATHFVDIARVLTNKPGVLNLHLATHTAPTSKNMTMLYKVATGTVQQRGYGIALARAMGFPKPFIAEAERVSKLLTERKEARREDAEFAKVMKRRKLVMGLYETLRQVAGSGMDEGAMGELLVRLRAEFIEKMSALYEGADGDGVSVDAAN